MLIKPLFYQNHRMTSATTLENKEVPHVLSFLSSDFKSQRRISGNLLLSSVFFLPFFGHTPWHVGSQFPDQGLNLHPLHGRQS